MIPGEIFIFTLIISNAIKRRFILWMVNPLSSASKAEKIDWKSW